MKLFMYAIVSHRHSSGFKSQEATRPEETIVVPPTAILAESEAQARFLIGQESPNVNFKEVDVYVRTF